MPNTRISTIPDTNSGTTVAERPMSTMARSMTRPRFSAATMPPRIPSGTTSTKATPPSFREFTSAALTKGATGER